MTDLKKSKELFDNKEYLLAKNSFLKITDDLTLKVSDRCNACLYLIKIAQHIPMLRTKDQLREDYANLLWLDQKYERALLSLRLLVKENMTLKRQTLENYYYALRRDHDLEELRIFIKDFFPYLFQNKHYSLLRSCVYEMDEIHLMEMDPWKFIAASEVGDHETLTKIFHKKSKKIWYPHHNSQFIDRVLSLFKNLFSSGLIAHWPYTRNSKEMRIITVSLIAKDLRRRELLFFDDRWMKILNKIMHDCIVIDRKDKIINSLLLNICILLKIEGMKEYFKVYLEDKTDLSAETQEELRTMASREEVLQMYKKRCIFEKLLDEIKFLKSHNLIELADKKRYLLQNLLIDKDYHKHSFKNIHDFQKDLERQFSKFKFLSPEIEQPLVEKQIITHYKKLKESAYRKDLKDLILCYFSMNLFEVCDFLIKKIKEDMSYIKITMALRRNNNNFALQQIEDTLDTKVLTPSEHLCFVYLKAECLRSQGLPEEALKIYQYIKTLTSQYRMLDQRIIEIAKDQ